MLMLFLEIIWGFFCITCGIALVAGILLFVCALDDIMYGRKPLSSLGEALNSPQTHHTHRPYYDDYYFYHHNNDTSSLSKSEPASKKSYSDPYEVHAFDTVEEFYEECGDEFHGFDDAADYFNTYRK